MISALDCRGFVQNLSLRHVDPMGGRVFRNTKPLWPCLEFLFVITKKKNVFTWSKPSLSLCDLIWLFLVWKNVPCNIMSEKRHDFSVPVWCQVAVGVLVSGGDGVCVPVCVRGEGEMEGKKPTDSQRQVLSNNIRARVPSNSFSYIFPPSGHPCCSMLTGPAPCWNLERACCILHAYLSDLVERGPLTNQTSFLSLFIQFE